LLQDSVGNLGPDQLEIVNLIAPGKEREHRTADCGNIHGRQAAGVDVMSHPAHRDIIRDSQPLVVIFLISGQAAPMTP
jgi:hypothetical protein